MYEIPAPLDQWTHQILWPGDQQSPGPQVVSQSQYNIVLNKQNMVLVDPNIHQNPIVLTTLAIDPAVLAPSKNHSNPGGTGTENVSLNPCILLKQNPETLLATIPENLQVVGSQHATDRTRVYNATLPSKLRHQNAETQTPRLVRHKESAV